MNTTHTPEQQLRAAIEGILASVIFDNDRVFRGRLGKEGYFQGEGERIETAPGRFLWETNFVADVTAFKLEAWEKRGGRSKNIRFALAGNRKTAADVE